jgi:hypothetical protein
MWESADSFGNFDAKLKIPNDSVDTDFVGTTQAVLLNFFKELRPRLM